MSEATREHLKHEALVSGLSNALFNGIIAWFLIRSGPALQWGGEHSFAIDVTATALLLPLIVALIVIPLQRSKQKKGKLQTMSLGPESPIQRLANLLPYSTGKSAIVFGLVGMLVIAPTTLLGFYLLVSPRLRHCTMPFSKACGLALWLLYWCYQWCWSHFEKQARNSPDAMYPGIRNGIT